MGTYRPNQLNSIKRLFKDDTNTISKLVVDIKNDGYSLAPQVLSDEFKSFLKDIHQPDRESQIALHGSKLPSDTYVPDLLIGLEAFHRALLDQLFPSEYKPFRTVLTTYTEQVLQLFDCLALKIRQSGDRKELVEGLIPRYVILIPLNTSYLYYRQMFRNEHQIAVKLGDLFVIDVLSGRYRVDESDWFKIYSPEREPLYYEMTMGLEPISSRMAVMLQVARTLEIGNV